MGAFLVSLGPRGWPLGSQMVDIGSQDSEWVGENDKEVSDMILLLDSLILLSHTIDELKLCFDYFLI